MRTAARREPNINSEIMQHAHEIFMPSYRFGLLHAHFYSIIDNKFVTMEERVHQFHETAEKRLEGAKLASEIATLRRFLFKNQEYRFSEREKQKLFTAVQVHYANPAALAADKTGVQLISGLIQDCLAMPFSVFSTAHKSAFLKWHWQLLGKDGDPAEEGSASAAPAQQYSCVGVSDEGFLELLCDDGSMRTDVKPSSAEEVSRIRAAVDAGEDVSVWVTASGSMQRFAIGGAS